MKEFKRRIESFAFYDHTAIEAHLEHMAQRGWLVEQPGNYLWRYRRIQPKKLHFSVTYFPNASDFDPGPTDGQRQMEEYCAKDGWIPTEFGTLYSKRELRDISAVCRKFKIPLYIDGARLGYGLMSKTADVTLPLLARYCDVFYIGGTKVGALCGEAVVFTRHNMPPRFTTIIKQHGALLAKGRLLGLQFDTLFTDDLYFKISKHAVEMAELLKKGFRENGYTFAWESPTNQQFIVLENSVMEKLQKIVGFSFWEKADEEHTIVRFATSWATTETDVIRLIELL